MKLIKKINHDELVPFVKECFEKKGFYTRSFIILLIILLTASVAVITFSIIIFFRKLDPQFLFQCLFALLISLTIIPVLHELMHALAYKLYGAKNIYFGANWRKFQFYACSDNEYYNGIQFKVIALFPFLIVTILSILALVLLPEYIPLWIIVISIHTLFCQGDFAFLSFVNQYDLKKIKTIDSKSEKASYFYLS